MRSTGTIFFLIVFLCLELCPVPLTSASFKKNATPLLQTGTQRLLVSARQGKAFNPAGVLSASDVQFPLETTADGIVVFDVSLNARGEITNMNPLTDILPLTIVAKSSLQSWKFIPASREDTTIRSRMLVAFVFRHAVKMWNPPPFKPVIMPREAAGYTPPGINSATYAEYPSSTIAAGATVLQVTVNANGMIGNLRVVRRLRGGFVPLAVKAATQWKFEPAMLDGTPVISKIAIAFVFSSRALNPI